MEQPDDHWARTHHGDGSYGVSDAHPGASRSRCATKAWENEPPTRRKRVQHCFPTAPRRKDTQSVSHQHNPKRATSRRILESSGSQPTASRDRPCAARIHNAFLGGSHNFGIDRTFAEQLENELPGITETYRESRAFLHRTVEHLITLGVRQFVDFGSGTPTIGHIHEIAVRYTRDFRVLYSDNEPLTVA